MQSKDSRRIVEQACLTCGRSFRLLQPWRKRTYCSLTCAYDNLRKSPAERFWAKVDKQSSPFGCWLWLASLTPSGYGKFGADAKGHHAPAHRFSWELNVGPIPDGLFVLHNCPGGDNPRCVNPAHLFLGTQTDNLRDMWAKGRGATTANGNHGSITHPESIPRGEQHPTRRLTNAQRDAVRAQYASGQFRQKDLARKYGVAVGTMNRILHGA